MWWWQTVASQAVASSSSRSILGIREWQAAFSTLFALLFNPMEPNMWTERMIRRKRCQTWTHLKLFGLPKSLVWPEPAGASVHWGRAVSLCWALEQPGRWWAAAFYALPGFGMALLLLQWFSTLHWHPLLLGICRLILATSVSKGLENNSLGNFERKAFFFLFPKSLLSLYIINRFVVKKLVAFDSGDESPDISETFNYITGASLVLRFKNVVLIKKKQFQDRFSEWPTMFSMISSTPHKRYWFYTYPYLAVITLTTTSRAHILF